MAPGRRVTHRYADPLDEVWIGAARRLGIEVRRSDAAYAAYDGDGTLWIASGDLDPDDSVAQMVFHELCHALVAGDGAMRRPDWGLDNVDESDPTAEYATHRLQAALADRYGLRDFFAVTTDHRPHWDALGPDPLRGDDASAERARDAMLEATRGPWAKVLDGALRATAMICESARAFAQEGSLYARTRPVHDSGFPLHDDPARRCADCAWLHHAGPGPRVPRCRQGRDPASGRAPRVDPDGPACRRHEPTLDAAACRRCGGCCREGYHLVPVGPREGLRRSHPELVTLDAHGAHLARPGGRCVALIGTGEGDAPYTCTVYPERPRACRQFDIASDACLQARRRVGLSY